MNNNIKVALLMLPLIIYMVASYYFSTNFSSEVVVTNQKLALCIASILCNFYVLYYHYTNPPHPKFLMLPARKFSIRVHIISGTIELGCGIVAFFSSDPAIWAIGMASAAIIGHITSSSYQTPIVFGAKAIMLPSYIFCIGLHLYCAVQVLLNPESIFWIVNTFLVLNIYVWCRVFYVLFSRIGIFKESLYSSSILVAQLLVVPAVLGAAGNLILIVFLLGYVLLYDLIMQPTPEERISFTRESARQTLINEQAKELWVTNYASPVTGATDRGIAREVFNQLDTDSNGWLDNQEAKAILKQWQVPNSFAESFISQKSQNERFSFELFYENIWQIPSIKQRLTVTNLQDEYLSQDPKKISDREKAQMIFSQLDIDHSGFLEFFEIQTLLLEWGLPDLEAQQYLTQYDDSGDKKFSFEEFFEYMRPIWLFAFSNILYARKASA
ncbi:EF-hand domain-containing protein [Chamaesiphon sp. OTE_75_metabat_556]|uniref:EF-hand domain-containing protein n=1 Tax=Chamaesiphon sp. OTE_75_metabat_556 TaxID=2964692 RepID=UPI00286CBE42|nr:EF-hand domain-containing protein [Chamaesiphon sp. OTE_75_metabat_556]